MHKRFQFITLASFVLAATFAIIGGFITPGYIQDLAAGTSTAFLGLALGLVILSYYLSASEKAEAAAPLAKFIAPAIQELHNELFYKLWENNFGIDKSKELLAKYQNNKGNPKAFSPKECDMIHSVILSSAPDLIRVYDLLHEQFRELSMITGWSFDPTVTANAMEARLNFLKFKSLISATDQESKYSMIEAYLDGEASAFSVLELLSVRLGLPKVE